jgi:hypothetical protein
MLSVIASTAQSSSYAQVQKAFIERAWMISDSLETFARQSKNRDPDPHAWWVLNGLSIEALFALAQSEAFTPPTRLTLARVAWTRAELLNKRDRADEILRFLATQDEAAAGLSKAIAGHQGAEREHQVLLLMLKHRDYSIQANWARDSDSRWCGHLNLDSYQDAMDDLLGPVLHYGEVAELDRWYYINYRSELRSPQEIGSIYGAFASRVGYTGVQTPRKWPYWLQASVDREELQAVARLPSAPEFLTRRAIAWAREDQGYFDEWLGRIWPEGEGGPGEALHRAILATKRDCRSLSHGAYSRDAWILLHGNAKWSQWAEKTPYWYDRFRNY